MSELDHEEQALVERLRALPRDGAEPDWDRFGREFGRVLDATPPRAPWWRRWWAPALGLSLAGATAAAVVLWPAPAATPEAPVAVLEADAAPARDREIAPPAPAPAVLALGAEGELDDDALDDDAVVTEVMAAFGEGADAELAEVAEVGDVPDEPLDGLVPDLELEWVDELDDADLDAVVAWLDDEET